MRSLLEHCFVFGCSLTQFNLLFRMGFVLNVSEVLDERGHPLHWRWHLNLSPERSRRSPLFIEICNYAAYFTEELA